MSHGDPIDEDEDTPQGVEVQHHEDLGQLVRTIAQDVKSVLRRLAKGDVLLAVLELRVKQLEKIVYTLIGLILVAVVTALLAMVVGHHP